ncbi:MAG: ankyrin repeat domain-containing protein [Ramlibacter sp.]
MRKYAKCLAYLVVSAWFSVASAGSYDDFFGAIKQDDAATVVNLLRRGFDPNTPSPEGPGGLYLALREPAPKVAQALIDWPQTNVEMRTAQDESPLMMAALKGQTALARRLIERGADVNKPGWAPLHYAATGGHLELMELLLENYAFIDAESPNGTTPLMMAAMYGTPAAVKLLLDAGADTAMKNKLGLTALDFARKANRADAVGLIEARMRSQPPSETPTQVPKPAGSW